MENKPLVSICSITFNHAPYIKECLEGFLMQQCDFNFEILIHDDASTDATADIIREFQGKYPQLIKPILQKENQWSQGIRNIQSKFNFSRAKGKYIALCEGDDYWTDPLKLQKQVDFLEQNPDYQMCFSSCELVKEKNVTSTFKPINNSREYSDLEILTDWIVPTASILYKNNLGLESEITKSPKVFFGDIFIFLINANKGKVFGFKDKMTAYRLHNDSMTNAKKSINYYERLLNHLIYLGEIYEGKYYPHVQKHIKEQAYKNFRYYLTKFNPKALKYFFTYLKN